METTRRRSRRRGRGGARPGRWQPLLAATFVAAVAAATGLGAAAGVGAGGVGGAPGGRWGGAGGARGLLSDGEAATPCGDAVRGVGLHGRTKCEAVRQECEPDGIVNYLEVYFCSVRNGEGSAAAKTAAFWTVMTLVLVMLFLTLGSTAEEYFAPVLTQLCEKIGLPPRFAGVTFLALANGAPDVSSTVAAVRGGGKGLYLSLGALTGAGMFVTTVAAAMIMLHGQGIKARGALVRDLIAYILALVLVLVALQSGTMGAKFAVSLLAMYFSFIGLVLIADVWHRREAVLKRAGEITEPLLKRDSSLARLGRRISMRFTGQSFANLQTQTPHSPHRFRNKIFKQMVEDEGRFKVPKPSRAGKAARDGADAGGAGASETPAGAEGQPAAGGRAGGGTGGGRGRGEGWSIYSSAGSDGEEDFVATRFNVEGPLGWRERLRKHAARALDTRVSAVEYFRDQLTEFKEGSPSTKFTMFVEFPVAVLRCLTIPTVIPEVYSKGMLVVSAGLVWFFIAGYLNQFAYGGFRAGTWALLAAGSALSGLLVSVTAAGQKPPQYRLGTKLPIGNVAISLVSFAVAAMWIDTLANELVGVLNTVGTLAHVEKGLLGLTILAWGNSIGDVQTNMAMAKRGLGNMAMTACIAGPIFNLLVGLGGGLLFYFSENGTNSVSVQLTDTVFLGILLLVINCGCMLVAAVAFKGQIPARYGYFLILLYAAYMLLSVINYFDVI